ncbi:HEAT repeat-containing protein [Plantibacter sp. VKM Ac-1784]|uniref:HEAT repeat-containing protein n=1 Tax=Plantibacter elymi (nom. nud.) TaxID=199708 RepID=A0ABY1RIJ6_9MICO|nr:HEAT repeat domain-containing protein [Plantibacter sp. VKM Ac-1784]SMQ75225.1 HEAT repeat-containing protein [Plantibacter sp. VKM Ac-1784]
MTAQNETPDPSTPATQASLEQRLADAVAAESETRVVERCVSLLAGRYEGEDFLRVVGGHHAEGILGGAPALYWPELWGTRALLHVWDDSATAPVVGALGNQAWRVREMAARVCAERRIGDVAALAPLLSDDHARVRAAGARALAVVGGEDAKPLLEALLRDPDREVRRAAQQSAKALATRR